MSMGSRASNRNPRGVTFVEMVMAVLLMAILSYFAYSLYMVSARRSAAGDKKGQTVRASLDVTGRIRRDLKWAWSATVGDEGKSLILSGPGGAERSYGWDEGSMLLHVPQIGNPTARVPYKLARFRKVSFASIGTSSRLRWLLSVLPADMGGEPSAMDEKYATTVCGEACLRRERGMRLNPDWNWSAECLE